MPETLHPRPKAALPLTTVYWGYIGIMEKKMETTGTILGESMAGTQAASEESVTAAIKPGCGVQIGEAVACQSDSRRGLAVNLPASCWSLIASLNPTNLGV